MSKKLLTTFITRVIANADDSNPVTALALLHERGNTSKQIHLTKFGGKYMKPDELADMFVNIATSYAAELETTQGFQLAAIYGAESPEAWQPFRVHPSADNGVSTEDASEKGVVKMGQRMLGDLHKLTLERQNQQDQAVNGILLRQNQIIEVLAGRVHDLTHENAQAFNVVKELISEKVTDNHEHRMLEIQATQKAEERRKMLQLLPALANTVTGREIFPQATSDTALIDTIAENLNESHIKQLMGLTLPPEIMGALMSRLNDAAEKKAQRDQARQLGPHPSPEDEAAGDA